MHSVCDTYDLRTYVCHTLGIVVGWQLSVCGRFSQYYELNGCSENGQLSTLDFPQPYLHYA
jgi:hypothetical protein